MRYPVLVANSNDENLSQGEAETLDELVVRGADRLRLVPGDKIGAFKVIRELGQGGFGAVYLCEQSEPVRRQVAIKIIKPGMDSESIIARFEAEQQAVAMMSHSSIAKVFEAGTTEEGRPYFVMEYVKGVPINEYCDKNKLDTQARLKLFAKVCDGVHHAHQKGIIHRDLKPGNILVTIADRREPQPKIIDFGIAKATNQQLTEKEIFTQVGQMIGTPEYMSPEQAEMSSEDIDTRTDVYSLGVVLYELLSGRLPFEPTELRSKGYAEIQRIIREDDPPKPSTNLTTVGDAGSRIAELRKTSIGTLSTLLRQELEWIPLKALRKDRTERYASADSLGQDVRRYLIGEPLEAGPETSMYRLKKLVRRNTGPFVAAALVALSLLGGVIASSIFAVQANTERARAEDRMQRLQSLVVELSGPINDSVKNLEGGMEVRKRMLSAGMQQLDLIRAEAEVGGDPELLHTVGKTLVSFGDLIGGPRVASGGDRDQARKHYDEALQIYASMGDSPQEEARLMIPSILGRKADLAVLDGEPEKAIEIIRESQELLRPAYGTGMIDHDRLYLASFERLGDIETATAVMFERLGENDAARGNRQAALEHAEAHQQGIERLLQAGNADDQKLRRDLAMTLWRTGRARSILGKGGEDDFVRARAILSEISEANPDDLRRRKDVGWADVYLGQCIGELRDSSRYPQSAEFYKNGAIEIVSICVAEPDSEEYRKDLVKVVTGVCKALVELGMPLEARNLREDALIAIQPVVERKPENLALSKALEALREISIPDA